MALDLQKMLHRKGEFESARIGDFAFRARARTMRLLAEAMGLDPAALVARTAEGDDDAILDALVSDGADRTMLDQAHYRARDTAERTLREEVGDRTPVRLA